jgi:hypothetical protein
MQLVALLVVVGLAVRLWPVIVGIISLFVAAYWGRRAVDRHLERVDAERRRLAGLRERADEQHRLVMQGDERGIYGEYPAAPV